MRQQQDGGGERGKEEGRKGYLYGCRDAGGRDHSITYEKDEISPTSDLQMAPIVV